MKWLRKLSKLSVGDITLLISTLMLLWCVRLGLWLLPFSVLRDLIPKAFGCPELDRGQLGQDRKMLWRCVWAVGVASRLVPQATCLTQALVAQVLLNRRGYKAIVHIGVAKGTDGKFTAHAWVEADGRVVVGGASASQWTPLTTLDVN